MKRLRIKVWVLLSVPLLLFTGCDSFFLTCPVSILDLDAIVGSYKDINKFGYTVVLQNVSPKTIESFEASFLLYSKNGAAVPVAGKNGFLTIVKNVNLLASETALYAVSLDRAGVATPTEEVIIKNYTITKITYIDGTEWDNPFGLYGYSGTNGTTFE
jgi:hypothetical protein